jgi:Fe-S-cluster-containing dehydrogenase component/Ni/Fe-hydrogenase subunit HybB-like protein
MATAADQPDRRAFLKHVACVSAANAGMLGGAGAALARTSDPSHADSIDAKCTDRFGVLVDMSMCVGCRLCEHACKQASGIDAGPLASYDDTAVFKTPRRPAPDAFTVVNAFVDPAHPERPVYTKLNCMHCNEPACVSACIVGALRKKDNGAVTYDAWKCIGCRYCMVACPFQLPAYEYDLALTPQVRKCQFCFTKISEGGKPACVSACPREALSFGRRSDLLAAAHERIEQHPGAYVAHVYGEHEVGGTSWMYLSPIPFEEAGFLALGDEPPSELTEHIQHGVFKYWIAPVAWYSFLAGMFWFTGRRERVQHSAKRVRQTAEPERSIIESLAIPRLAIASPGGGVVSAMGISATAPPARARRACHDEHQHKHEAAPVRRRLLTPGVWLLISLVLLGLVAFAWRMIFGLAATTHLTQQRPWGLWIAMDVGSGIALAGGGFVACAIFHILHRQRYHMLARSALVCALLGYTFYVPGLLADLGKWWKLPITMLPTCWQGNSVLFEVGMCVMIYLNVQYAELTPIICERLLGESWFKRWPRLYRLTQLVSSALTRIMPALLCMGVCLSTFHQSSLGNLMVIAPYKLHHLWWSPLAPLLFLLSAMMVGLPMVIFTILFASWSLSRQPEMETLAPLARRYVPPFIAIYVATKIGDTIWRGTGHYLLDGSYEGWLWIAEMLLVVAPLALFLVPRICRTPRLLAGTCLSVILGVVLNRLNVFVLAFHPPFQSEPYIPSLVEFMLSIGLVAALLLVYRIAVTYLPILEPRPERAVA